MYCVISCWLLLCNEFRVYFEVYMGLVSVEMNLCKFEVYNNLTSEIIIAKEIVVVILYFN